MTIPFKSVLSLAAILCVSSSAQAPSADFQPASQPASPSASNNPSAYIYVSRTVSGGSENEVQAFSAESNGKLAAVPGSPFQENVKEMAVSGKFLFATSTSGAKIESYRIEAGGALRYATTTTIGHANKPNSARSLFLDRTGTTLYDMEANAAGYGNNAYQSFVVDRPVGNLEIVGDSSSNSWLANPATFVGNNTYAYSASCLQNMYWGIYGFKRSDDGLLAAIDISANPPDAPDGYFYCPAQAAADSSEHVAIAMQAVNQSTFDTDRAAQLATYTADAKGNLKTTSTRENMPQTSVGTVKDLKMSPSGKLLAVGGTGGLQVFHFNGSKPVTHYTGLLTKYEIDQFFWDNQNHLYAISRPAGKLYVFTITPSSYAQASGSPHLIEKPQAIIVQAQP